jgi:nuclear pore complex protein Nup155
MSLATPQRALPGTFFNTPAVNRFAPPLRQPVFSAPSQPARASSNPQSPQSAAPVSQSSEPVQRAARTINEVLQREAGFPDLDSYVRRKCEATKVGLQRVLTK